MFRLCTVYFKTHYKQVFLWILRILLSPVSHWMENGIPCVILAGLIILTTSNSQTNFTLHLLVPLIHTFYNAFARSFSSYLHNQSVKQFISIQINFLYFSLQPINTHTHIYSNLFSISLPKLNKIELNKYRRRRHNFQSVENFLKSSRKEKHRAFLFQRISAVINCQRCRL